MHDQVRVRHRGVDLADAVDRQDVAGRRTGELVGAMAGADRDRQRVDPGGGDEILGLRRVGQQHVVAELALGTDAVLLAGLAGLERAQAAEFALDRDADRMRDLADLARDLDVVVVGRRGLGVLEQRAVHHHAGEARADRLDADRRRGAVVLVQHDGEVGVRLDGGEHQVAQVGLAGVLARASRGLQDHRRHRLLRRLHDRVDLLEVVDVERRHAVAVFGGVVEQLTQGDQGHVGCSWQ